MSKKLQNKKDQFTQPEKSRLPFIIGVSVALVAIAFIIISNSGEKEEELEYFGDPIASERSYVGEFVSMTTVEPVIQNGKIEISLDEVDRNNIVNFEVENNENELVPLMAYITPTGRLFAGSSLCEPCRGRTFSLAGETLVCDTCRTTYTIEDHQFISGAPACGSYPPVYMNPKVEDGTIVIELDEVLKWRIRT